MSERGREILIRRVYRIGVQTVEHDGAGRYFLTIRNRTYRSEVEVDRATAWRYWRFHRQAVG